jgi:RNA polymerase sigma factor (TIGR02999 family)
VSGQNHDPESQVFELPEARVLPSLAVMLVCLPWYQEWGVVCRGEIAYNGGHSPDTEAAMPSELHTTALRQLLARFHNGDAAALNELFERATRRLERMARAMLRRFPQVRQREQTGDVVQEAALGLVGALRQLSFSSTRDFYALAAEHIRRRLLDLNRRHQKPHRDHLSLGRGAGVVDRVSADSEAELELWADLHEAVETLPAELREVFCLRFYHGWGLPQIAELLDVSTRTVTRLWLRAQMALTGRLADRPLPAVELEGERGASAP